MPGAGVLLNRVARHRHHGRVHRGRITGTLAGRRCKPRRRSGPALPLLTRFARRCRQPKLPGSTPGTGRLPRSVTLTRADRLDGLMDAGARITPLRAAAACPGALGVRSQRPDLVNRRCHFSHSHPRRRPPPPPATSPGDAERLWRPAPLLRRLLGRIQPRPKLLDRVGAQLLFVQVPRTRPRSAA